MKENRSQIMSSDNIQGLETLEAWKRAKDFAVKVCKEVLPLLPAEEKWSLRPTSLKGPP
jgi:hypothetical protein